MTGAARMPQHQVRLPLHIIDLSAHELRSATGDHVDLRPRSFAVLRLLAENAGRLVTKDEIIAKVWNDAVVTEDSLTQCVADIRKAIGDEARRILRTVPRKGYVLVAAQRTSELPGRVPDRPSLAIMPFRSFDGPASDVFAYGVASEIINELARNKDLRLIARDSSFPLAGQQLRAQELGEWLGVRYLAEGSVRRTKDMLFVDVQLVDARDGSIAWGDRFSARAADIPEVQWDIAAKIAGTLHSGMRETEKRAILGRAPRDLDVYELTLRGIACKHLFAGEATQSGRRDLQEAIRRDPNYAPAYVYLGWLNLIDMQLQLTGDFNFTQLGDVIGQLSHAIELDPNLPCAYQGLSQAIVFTGDIAQAVTLARRSVELGPSDADNLLFLAVALLQQGEVAEAETIVEKALDLNPLRPAYYPFYHAMILWGAERYAEALAECEECLRKAPDFRGAEVYRIVALVGLDRVEEAKARYAQYIAQPELPFQPPLALELKSRFLAQFRAAGYRPTLTAAREAG